MVNIGEIGLKLVLNSSQYNKQLNDVKNNSAKVSKSFSSLSKSVDITNRSLKSMGQTASKTSNDLKKINNSNKDINKGMDSVAKKSNDMGSAGAKGFNMLKTAAVAAAVVVAKALFDFGKASVKVASDLTEVQNVVDVTFGESANIINNFAKNAIKNFGLSELSAKKFASTIGAIGKSSNVTGTDLVNMSTGVASLAGDLASFFNLSPEESFEKLRSGLIGNTEPLSALGIDMRIAALNAYALSLGIKENVSDLSTNNQMLLRYKYILEQTKDAQGDYVRTSDNWANQLRTMYQTMQQVMANFGKGIINVLTPILPVINKIISGLMLISQVFAALAGVKPTLAADMNKAATSASNTAAGVKDTTKAIKEAQKAQKSIMGFDKLNNISKPDKGTGTDSEDGGGKDYSSLLSIPSMNADLNIAPKIDTAKIEETVNKIKGFFSGTFGNIDFTNIKNSFNNLKDSIEPITTKIGDGLKWFMENILAPLAKFTIESLLPAFFDTLGAALDLLNIVIEAAKPTLQWLWDEFLSKLFTIVGAIVLDFLDGFTKKLQDLGKWIKENQTFMDVLLAVLIGFGTALAILSVATGIWNVVSGIGAVTTTALGTAFAILTSPITLVILAITAVIAIAVLLFKNWDKIKEKAGELGLKIKEVFDGVKQKIGEFAEGAKEFLKGFFDFAVEMFKGLVNFLLHPFVVIIEGLNTIIGLANKIKIDIPDWIPVIGGKSFGVNLPEIPIPKLAQGGYVGRNQPQLAMIGDNTKTGEIVAPEDKLTAIMAQTLDNFFAKFEGKNNNDSPIILNTYLEVDGKIFFSDTKKMSMSEARRTNTSQYK